MTEDTGTSFSDADEAPDDDDDVTQDDTAQDTAQDDNTPEPNAGAHPIIDEPDSSLGQAAVPAPDTNAESQIQETE